MSRTERRSHQAWTNAAPVIATAPTPVRSNTNSPMLDTKASRRSAGEEGSSGASATASIGPAQKRTLTTCAATKSKYGFIDVFSSGASIPPRPETALEQ